MAPSGTLVAILRVPGTGPRLAVAAAVQACSLQQHSFSRSLCKILGAIHTEDVIKSSVLRGYLVEQATLMPLV
jgi:hypothetical protein